MDQDFATGRSACHCGQFSVGGLYGLEQSLFGLRQLWRVHRPLLYVQAQSCTFSSVYSAFSFGSAPGHDPALHPQRCTHFCVTQMCAVQPNSGKSTPPTPQIRKTCCRCVWVTVAVSVTDRVAQTTVQGRAAAQGRAGQGRVAQTIN